MKSFSAILLVLVCVSCQPTSRNQSKDDLSGDMTQQPFLVVLGIAQDGGIPHPGCDQACCKDRWYHPDERFKVACLGIVDPVSGECWMVDATPDFPAQQHALLNYLPGSGKKVIDGLFLSHGHIGHYAGLMYLGREAMGTHDVPVYAAPLMQEFLAGNGPWDLLLRLKNIRICNLDAGHDVELNDRVRITPIMVPHRGEYTETLAFRISISGRSTLYIPDIDHWEDWEKDIKSEILIHDKVLIDGTFFNGDELPGRDMSEIPHPTISHTMQLLNALPGEERQKVSFFHFNHTNPVLNPDSKAFQLVMDAGYGICQEGEIIIFQ